MAANGRPASVSINSLLAHIKALKLALEEWRRAHDVLYAEIAEHHTGGWLHGQQETNSFESRMPVPGSLSRALCSLESDDEESFRLIGVVYLPSGASEYVQAANAARLNLDQVSHMLRSTKLSDLERMPEGQEIGGSSLAYWTRLRPADTIWKAVTATLGVPRIQIRYAIRPLLLEGCMTPVPRFVTFARATQRIISVKSLEYAREQLEHALEAQDTLALAVQRDVNRFHYLAGLSPRPRLAYIYRGDSIFYVNFAWLDEHGEKIKKKIKTSLPLFWCGSPQRIQPPRSFEPRIQKRRSDQQYADSPVFETVKLYTTREVHQSIFDSAG